MTPYNSILDVPNMTSSNAVVCRNESRFARVGAYGYNGIGRELGVSIVLAAKRNLPPLADHICHVVGISPDKKVRWVNARRVIAAVTNKHAILDWAVFLLIGQPVSHVVFPIDPKLAVSLSVLGPCPIDAPGSRVDGRPESQLFLDRHSSGNYGCRKFAVVIGLVVMALAISANPRWLVAFFTDFHGFFRDDSLAQYSTGNKV